MTDKITKAALMEMMQTTQRMIARFAQMQDDDAGIDDGDEACSSSEGGISSTPGTEAQADSSSSKTDRPARLRSDGVASPSHKKKKRSPNLSSASKLAPIFMNLPLSQSKGKGSKKR